MVSTLWVRRYISHRPENRNAGKDSLRIVRGTKERIKLEPFRSFIYFLLFYRCRCECISRLTTPKEGGRVGRGREEKACALDLWKCDVYAIFSRRPFLFYNFSFSFFPRYLDLFRASSLQSMVFFFSADLPLELTQLPFVNLLIKGWTIRKVMGGGGEGNFRAAAWAVAWIFFRVNWRAWIFFI